MVQQVVGTGSAPNDGTGDSLLVAFTKINENFTEIYGRDAAGSNFDLSQNYITVLNTNGDIELIPNGTGSVIVSGVTYPNADGTAGQALVTDGSGTVSFATPNTIFNGTSNISVVNNGNVNISAAGVTNVATVSSTGLFSSKSLGFTVGAGGTVTQLTDKSTAVTLNAPSGQITTNAATLNNNISVSFVLNNTYISADDVIVTNFKSGNTVLGYRVEATPGTNQATISLKNVSGGNLSEAIVLQYVVIKAVTS